MNTPEEFDAAEQFLATADRVRGTHPNAAAMVLIELPDLPPADGALLAALRFVRDEVLAVRAGMADGVGVLAEEIANARRVLAAVGAGCGCCAR